MYVVTIGSIFAIELAKSRRVTTTFQRCILHNVSATFEVLDNIMRHVSVRLTQHWLEKGVPRGRGGRVQVSRAA